MTREPDTRPSITQPMTNETPPISESRLHHGECTHDQTPLSREGIVLWAILDLNQ